MLACAIRSKRSNQIRILSAKLSLPMDLLQHQCPHSKTFFRSYIRVTWAYNFINSLNMCCSICKQQSIALLQFIDFFTPHFLAALQYAGLPFFNKASRHMMFFTPATIAGIQFINTELG